MHQPPPGPGYGAPPPYHGGHGGHGGPPGYGGPPGPYGPPYPPYGGGYGGPPPPKPGPNVALIVLLAIVGGLIVLGGGCAVCVALAGSAKTADGADASSDPSLGTGERTVDRTPLARKLEEALKGDKIPVDYVECPLNPPTSGTFSCAVMPTNNGDPAEISVTIGPSGMSYKLQEGFVLLEGAKLATTFAGIAAQMKTPRLTAPCFQGTIMKHVDSSFTCDVMDGGAVVGHVTTTVVNKTGGVKMNYEPGANAKAAPTPSGGARMLDGTYACIVFTMTPAGGVQTVPSLLPRFTIAGGTYSTNSGRGTVSAAGDVLSFSGGPYDAWQGLLATNSTGRYVLFRGADHAHAMPGVTTKMGDHQCYVQK